MNNRSVFVLVVLLLSVGSLPSFAHAQTSSSLVQALAGRILLQVEANGEAYYVDPVDLQRYSLGRPSDAFVLMTAKGLGVAHEELDGYLSTMFPARLSGRILLDVERQGQAYYIDPLTLQATYLESPTAAFALMERAGLGITNADLARIPLGSLDVSPLAQATFNKINDYRVLNDRSALIWNDDVATQAQSHSTNMADGSVTFGHEGFSERIAALRDVLSFRSAAENVAKNNYDNTVKTAVDGWIASPGHLKNILNDSLDMTGIGVAADGDTYFFTQIFIDAF